MGVRRRNKKRHAEQLDRQFGDLAAYVRELPCAVCGLMPSDPHHVRNRRMFGAWIDGVGNIANLCRWHHEELHRIGRRTFARRYDIDLAALAAENGEAFKRGDDPCPIPW